jgi:hypothetical protein
MENRELGGLETRHAFGSGPISLLNLMAPCARQAGKLEVRLGMVCFACFYRIKTNA